MASGPATPAPRPGCSGASTHERRGCSRPCCAVLPGHRGVSPASWASLAGPAPAGAGGCARLPGPLRCSANWKARLKPMRCPRPQAPRAKRHGVGRKPWGAARVVVASHVSPAGAMMTTPDPRGGRGAVGRGRSSSRRPALAPCRRGRQRPTWLCKQAGDCLRPRPAVPERAGRRACVRHASAEGLRARRRPRASGRGAVGLLDTLAAGVARRAPDQPARRCRVLAVPAALSSMECVGAGRPDLAGGVRARHRVQSEEGCIGRVL